MLGRHLGAGAREAGRGLGCWGEHGRPRDPEADPIRHRLCRGAFHLSCSPKIWRDPSPTFSRTSTANGLSEKSGGHGHALCRCFPDVEGDRERASDRNAYYVTEMDTCRILEFFGRVAGFATPHPVLSVIESGCFLTREREQEWG